MMRLDGELFKKPEPIANNSTYERLKWFKGCLGALDGTHVKIRVLRDATRRPNGLRVPEDAGFTNCKGFLAPFRGQRYHLNEREGRHPTTA
ncbi:protein ALP1-like [Senna tora]|uniref:Protein ALP1-like n=1 Tax=Senna tora TaxID=362788 RepID=A0A834X0F7_9FABA|nr:protein ALP1-like [Senna tora]